MSSSLHPSFHAPDLFKLLAHDLRWGIVSLLAHSDYSGQELVRFLQQPQNLVSYHLKLLLRQHLIKERRNSADERSIYFSLDLETLQSLYLTSGIALHPALRICGNLSDTAPESWIAAEKPLRVLFLCTHNSARSQMAEGMLRTLSHGRIEVLSAGSQPAELNPMAIQAAASLGVDIQHQHAKNMDEFLGQSFDYVITVCDRVRETCPTFPGEPERIHWSIPDPIMVEGAKEERYQAFEQIAQQLMLRIRYFLLSIEQR
jgi:Protein-tyrosine-phosphatase